MSMRGYRKCRCPKCGKESMWHGGSSVDMDSVLGVAMELMMRIQDKEKAIVALQNVLIEDFRASTSSPFLAEVFAEMGTTQEAIIEDLKRTMPGVKPEAKP